jgi:hypothetical protein
MPDGEVEQERYCIRLLQSAANVIIRNDLMGANTLPGSRCFTEQLAQVERPRVHSEVAFWRARPFLFRLISIKLEPVAVGVLQIKRITDAVIARAV